MSQFTHFIRLNSSHQTKSSQWISQRITPATMNRNETYQMANPVGFIAASNTKMLTNVVHLQSSLSTSNVNAKTSEDSNHIETCGSKAKPFEVN